MMSGVIPLLPLCAFIARTGKTIFKTTGEDGRCDAVIGQIFPEVSKETFTQRQHNIPEDFMLQQTPLREPHISNDVI
jgi:hypothetical protein